MTRELTPKEREAFEREWDRMWKSGEVWDADKRSGLAAFAAGLSCAEQPENNEHVAWLCFHRRGEATTIHVCDSDDIGAFKVYRRGESEQQTKLAVAGAYGAAAQAVRPPVHLPPAEAIFSEEWAAGYDAAKDEVAASIHALTPADSAAALREHDKEVAAAAEKERFIAVSVKEAICDIFGLPRTATIVEFIEYRRCIAQATAPLVEVLQRIAQGELNTPFEICNCTHDDENCCEKVGEWCPQCIAATALAAHRAGQDAQKGESK